MKSKSLLVFLLALWASLAVHAWDFTEHLIGYNILNGTEVEVDMIITSEVELYPDKFQNVTIPQQVSFHDVSYNVIGINANAFYNCSIPVSITLPEGLMTIGDNAFRGCSSLTNINLPESLTSIGDYAFYGCSNLTIMTIPEGLTSIGNYVFCGCSVPTSITIPESLTDIGDYAFSSCTNLNSITLPEGVTSIGDHTFYRCSSLTSITLPESLTNIGNNAFHCCSSLTSITLPENLTTIGNCAFEACSSLANINLPEGLTSIGEAAFSGCSSLTNIIIPEGLTSIVKHTFNGCTNLTSITLPKTLTSIGQSAFSSCSSLTNINLPAGLTSIGDYAFYGCSSLTSITLPKGLTSIGHAAFYNCSSLTSVNAQIQEPFSIGSIDFAHISSDCVLTVPAGTKDAYIAKGWTTDVFKGGIVEMSPNIDFADANVKAICVANWDTNNDGELSYEEAAAVTSLGEVFKEDTEITSFDELQYFTGLTSIGDYTFFKCNHLISISVPNRVTKIENHAFWGCTSLTAIDISNSVTRITGYAFSGCTSLTAIDIPNSVTYISGNPFENCTSLTSVTIPANVTSISEYAFEGCTNLKSAVVRAADFYMSAFQDSGLETLYIGKEVSKIKRRGCGTCPFTNLKQLVIEDGDNELWIDDYTNDEYEYSYGYGYDIQFSYSPFQNSCLETVYIGRNIEGYELAFGGLFGKTAEFGSANVEVNDKLTSVTIGDNVTKIPHDMCVNCIGLTSIVVPNGVISIGSSAFVGCTSLTSITIPNSVTSIGDGTFQDCSNLTSITIPENVASIGRWAFKGTAWYNNLPDGLVYIGKVAYQYKGTMPDNTELILKLGTLEITDEAIEACTGLTSVTIPNSVTRIGSHAFRDCSNLTTVSISNSITNIGAYAFYNCSNLTSFTIPKTVTDIGRYAFAGCTGLTSVVSYVQEPFYIFTGDFNSISSNCVLTVPAGTKKAYIAKRWTTDVFKGGIVEMDGSVSVTLGSAGAATFCSVHDLDFFGTDDVKAYIVSAFSPSAGEVMLTRVYDVPAGTGIVLLGNAGTYDIPIGTGETVTSNLLVGTTADKTLYKVSGSYTNFVLANGASGLGFYTVADGSVLAAGKAYLPLLTAGLPSSAAQFSFRFNDDGTSFIRSLDVKDTREGDDWFSLDGRQLNAEPTAKSLYIRNGRKVIVR